MSQHDYIIANALGADFRADINNALGAVVSLNEGTTAPATTYAYMLWADTTNGVLKQRNSNNTAWVIRDRTGAEGVAAKTGTYPVVLGDYGKLINATSGTWDLTLTAAATLGDGFWFAVRNSGTGVVTINPDGSETIDGVTSLALPTGAAVLVYCNGAAFFCIGVHLGLAQAWTGQQYFAEATLTDAASIDWNLAIAQVAKVTITDNRSMAAATNMKAGAYYGLRVIQDSNGGHTLGWDSMYKFVDATAPTISTGANAQDFFVFRSDGTYLYEQGRSQGVA